MIYCGLDTETTGLPNQRLDAKHEEQARVVQLALKLVSKEGRVISQFSSLIRPSGWREIHPKAFEAHGITKEDCAKFGIEAEKAFYVFKHYADLADMVVAHNADFDKGMMAIESKALGIEMPKIDWHCTMKQATPICKVPPTDAMVRAGRTHYKNANLTEALKIICGEDLEGAHDAMVDVTGCMKIFLAMQHGQKAVAA